MSDLQSHTQRWAHHRQPREACPPDHNDIGNAGWWHHRFCAECAPVEYAEQVSA